MINKTFALLIRGFLGEDIESFDAELDSTHTAQIVVHGEAIYKLKIIAQLKKFGKPV